eukprot:SAG22_NODE_1002_length_6052_cov_3.257558_3_plen_191_part_00
MASARSTLAVATNCWTQKWSSFSAYRTRAETETVGASCNPASAAAPPLLSPSPSLSSLSPLPSSLDGGCSAANEFPPAARRRCTAESGGRTAGAALPAGAKQPASAHWLPLPPPPWKLVMLPYLTMSGLPFCSVLKISETHQIRRIGLQRASRHVTTCPGSSVNELFAAGSAPALPAASSALSASSLRAT